MRKKVCHVVRIKSLRTTLILINRFLHINEFTSTKYEPIYIIIKAVSLSFDLYSKTSGSISEHMMSTMNKTIE